MSATIVVIPTSNLRVEMELKKVIFANENTFHKVTIINK